MKHHNISLGTAALLLAVNINANNLSDYLATVKTYNIDGTFTKYDFEEASTAFDWAFVTPLGKAYQLQGKEPTKASAFGWKSVSISPSINESSWNMINLGDWDKDGDTKFDWVLIRNQNNTNQIYKLGGANESGNFIYEKINGLTANISNNKIEFISDSPVNIDIKPVKPSSEPIIKDTLKNPYENNTILPGVTIIENSKNSKEPLKNATIYDKNGKNVGLKTDKFGNIFLSDLKSKGIEVGDIITISKNGYQAVKVKVSNSNETLPISHIDNKLLLKVKNGAINTDLNIVNKKTYTASSKTIKVSYDITSLKSAGDITIATIPVESSSDIKITNNIDMNGTSVAPSQLTIVGGVMFTIKDSKRNPITLGKVNNLNLQLKQISFLGDMEKILNGYTEDKALQSNAVKIAEETYKELQDAIAQGILSFYIIQKDTDGINWEYKADAKITTVTKKGKTFYVMSAKNNVALNNFSDIAFVLKTDKFKGDINVCVHTKEWKYPDGSLVQMDKEESVKDAIINGDNNLTTQWVRTNNDGCKKVEYSVPFLSPTFAINIDKEHYFNTTTLVDVEAGKLRDEKIDVYLTKRPPYGSVYGYVLDKVTAAGLPGALVELRDPQILTKDRVKFDSETIRVPFNEDFKNTVTYTWTLQKDGKDIQTLKNGKGRENASLNIQDVFNVVIAPYENGKNLNINPLGNYTIALKIVIDKSNTTVTEEALIDFSLSLDEYAVKLRTSFSVNQGNAPIYKTEDNSEVTIKDGQAYDDNDKKINRLVSYSIYGGKDLGYWYSMSDAAGSGDADSHYWSINVAAASDKNYNNNDCLDVTHEPALQGGDWDDDTCVVEIIKPADKVEQKSEYTNAYLLSYINKNFNKLLQPDSHPDANGLPYLLSGFNYYITYHRNITIGGVSYYSDIPSTHYLNGKDDGGFNNIREAIKIDNVILNLNDALGFKTLKAETSDEAMGDDNKKGYYEFMYAFPPKVSEKLELRAKAEGYKIDSENLIQLDHIDAYKKRRYDFKLTSATAATIGDIKEDDSKPQFPVIFSNAIWFGFERENSISDYGWSIKDFGDKTSLDVTWNLVTNNNLPLTNDFYKNNIVEDSSIQSILPAADGIKYAWFGNTKTGTYSDNSDGTDSTMPVGKFLVSPVIDFSNMPLAKATVKAWYEVSGEDDIIDAAVIGFILPKDKYNDEIVNLDWAKGTQTEVKTDIAYMRRITPISETILPGMTGLSQVSNIGMMSEPQWKTYELPLNILAGRQAQLVFGFITKDNKNNNLRGFGIDSILITDDINVENEDVRILDCLPGENCTQEMIDNADEETFVPMVCLPGENCK